MALPEFLDHIQTAAKDATGWLTPETVADLHESDFHTLRPAEREKLFQAVERFRTIAETASPSPEQVAEARAAFDLVREILRYYLTPESETVRGLIARPWAAQRDWLPTFDYELRDNWLGEPVAWIRFIVKDEHVDEDGLKDDPFEKRWKDLVWSVREAFWDSGLERRPNISMRSESEVRDIQAGVIP
jgi:hypothetical protein